MKRVSNRKHDFGELPEYLYIRTRDEDNGQREISLLFTEREIKVGSQRAAKNPDMIPPMKVEVVKPWWQKIF